MVFWRKIKIAALSIVLGGLATVPFSTAQTFSVLQNDSSGAYLGITMENVMADTMAKYKLNSEKGVIVSSVTKGSPAEIATIKENDVILEFGGFPVWSSFQLLRLVQETPIGRKTDLVISRDGKRLNLSVVLERRGGRQNEGRRGVLRMAPFQGGPYEFRKEFPEVPEDQRSILTERKPRLGVTLQPLTDQLAEFLGVPGNKGVLITSVVKGSASEGKLRSGDVVIEVNNKHMDTPEEFTQFIRTAPAGQITLKIIRDKKPLSVIIDLLSDDNRKGYKL
jgi:serine protease Do